METILLYHPTKKYISTKAEPTDTGLCKINYGGVYDEDEHEFPHVNVKRFTR